MNRAGLACDTMQTAVHNRNAWETAYDAIQDLILQTGIPPGAAVTETALSRWLGISRTPIREALKRLEQEGLIVIANRRKYVCLRTICEIEELFELKICIEGAVAGWAAEGAGAGRRRDIKAALGRMKRLAAGRPADIAKEQAWLDGWLARDQRFHALVFDIAGNQRARQIIRTRNLQWRQFKLGMLTLEGRVERSVVEHEAVADAILSGRPACARRAMESHLRNLRCELVKLMRLRHYPTL